MSSLGIQNIMQVLFLDIKKDVQHKRLLAIVQAARQHLQTAGVSSSVSQTVHGPLSRSVCNQLYAHVSRVDDILLCLTHHSTAHIVPELQSSRLACFVACALLLP